MLLSNLDQLWVIFVFRSHDRAVGLEHDIVLLAKLNDGTLLAPRVELDLIDSRGLAGIDQLLEVLQTAVPTK